MQCGHKRIDELPQLASRQLSALCDIGGLEGEQVGGGDEGPVERGQQVREGPRLEVGQHLQQVRHGIFTRAAVLMGAALRKGLARAGQATAEVFCLTRLDAAARRSMRSRVEWVAPASLAAPGRSVSPAHVIGRRHTTPAELWEG